MGCILRFIIFFLFFIEFVEGEKTMVTFISDAYMSSCCCCCWPSTAWIFRSFSIYQSISKNRQAICGCRFILVVDHIECYSWYHSTRSQVHCAWVYVVQALQFHRWLIKNSEWSEQMIENWKLFPRQRLKSNVVMGAFFHLSLSDFVGNATNTSCVCVCEWCWYAAMTVVVLFSLLKDWTHSFLQVFYERPCPILRYYNVLQSFFENPMASRMSCRLRMTKDMFFCVNK